MASDTLAHAPSLTVPHSAPRAAAPNLLQRLKAETAEAHAQAEQAIDLDACTRSVGAYRGLVSRFYGVHAAFEAGAATALPAELLSERRKTPMLRADLRALGLAGSEIDALPQCDLADLVASPADAMGVMYVLEGSTLGGSVIAHHVARRLGLGPDAGCSYFGCYGNRAASMWKAFGTQFLERSAPYADDVIVAAADRTFVRLTTWLPLGEPVRAAQD